MSLFVAFTIASIASNVALWLGHTAYRRGQASVYSAVCGSLALDGTGHTNRGMPKYQKAPLTELALALMSTCDAPGTFSLRDGSGSESLFSNSGLGHGGCSINPASGLPMISGDACGFDVSGNAYGFNNSPSSWSSSFGSDFGSSSFSDSFLS